MNAFYFAVEIFLYAFAVYLIIFKGDLSIIYLPVVYFALNVIIPSSPAIVYYAVILFLIFNVIMKNGFFYRNNIYSILLIAYFAALIHKSADLEAIRPYLFSAFCYFISLPLISAVYQKYPREVIFRELTTAAVMILVIFIVNVLISSATRYSPFAMYGITSGILYGNLYATAFNILAVALFVVLLSVLSKQNMVYLIIFVVSLAFIFLSLRRSVICVSLLGVAVAVLSLLTQKRAKMILLFGCFTLFAGYIIYTNTDFMAEFTERYEMRKLDDRALEEEKRFLEYELVLEDMFVYEKYSPWFGFELYNSWGNYGKGILEERSLHADLTNIAHSSGLIGVFLYLMMVFTSFKQAMRSASSALDKLIFFFCAATFAVFTITGRYTEAGAMTFMFLVLMLPITKGEPTEAEALHLVNDQRAVLEFN